MTRIYQDNKFNTYYNMEWKICYNKLNCPNDIGKKIS